MSEIYIMESRTPWHLMNIVKVLQPRWHDRVILPRVDKFKSGGNIITIKYKDKFPNKYYLHSETAKRYPQETKYSQYGDYQVYVIPLSDLKTVQEVQEILSIVKEMF